MLDEFKEYHGRRPTVELINQQLRTFVEKIYHVCCMAWHMLMMFQVWLLPAFIAGFTLTDSALRIVCLYCRFDPDRFSPENSKTRGTYNFVPFGFAGKRKCPGYKLAYSEAAVLVATLIRR